VCFSHFFFFFLSKSQEADTISASFFTAPKTPTMKSPILALALAAWLTSFAGNAGAAELVGWYQFNNSNNLGLDSSGNNNNGTLYNDGILPVYSSNGIDGGSAYFQGTFNTANQNFQGGGGMINVPINTGPTAMPYMTWGAWINPMQVDYGRYVISSDQYNGGRSLGIDNRASDNYAAITGNQSPYFYNTGLAPVTNSWIFIGGVYQNNYFSQGSGLLTMYVGNQVFSNIVTSFNNNSPSFTSIGGNAGTERYWNGYIDNVFIINGYASQSQMNDIINNPTLIPQIALAIAPEPSTYALFGLGALALIVAYRRRNGCVATAGPAKVA